MVWINVKVELCSGIEGGSCINVYSIPENTCVA